MSGSSVSIKTGQFTKPAFIQEQKHYENKDSTNGVIPRSASTADATSAVNGSPGGLLSPLSQRRAFISRSQDNLVADESVSTVAALANGKTATPRKGSTPHNTGGSELFATDRRPQSSLSVAVANNKRIGALKSATTPAITASRGLVRGSSPSSLSDSNNCAKENRVPFPLVASKTGASAKPAITPADVKITKTRVTMTELQKQKQSLESQVSELVKNATHRQTEIATLRMELNHARAVHDEQLDQLRRENEALKRKLKENASICDTEKEEVLQHAADGTLYVNMPIIGSTCLDAATSPIKKENILATSESSVDGAGSSDETGPCDVLPIQGRSLAEWDRQSSSSMSEISLACLQDRIVQMEETHHSTNEELQATLQELTDLQDMVNELSTQNQQLMEEKRMLLETLCGQTAKLDNCRLQIENLKHLLLSDTTLKTAGGRGKQATALVEVDENREGQLFDLLKSSQAEHEELLGKYVEIRGALAVIEEENEERREMITILKDRSRLLEAQVGSLMDERRLLEDTVFDTKQQLDRTKREVVRVSNLYEKERCRVEELQRYQANVAESSENKGQLEALLNSVRREKDRADERMHELEETLSVTSHELERHKMLLSSLKEDEVNRNTAADNMRSILEERLHDLEQENEMLKKQIVELRSSLIDLDERCQRHVDDKKEYKTNILQLQNAIEDVTAQREAMRKDLLELQMCREQEALEWREFQSDLQVAVVVANDFKMEAQGDIDRLTEENSHLRDKLNSLNAEMERLRQLQQQHSTRFSPQRAIPSAASLFAGTPGGPGNDVKTRMESYKANVERTLRQGSPIGANGVGGSAGPKPTVRALIENLEATSQQSGIGVALRSAPPLLRSPGSNRHSVAAMQSPTSSDVLSKSSSSLMRPASVDNSDMIKQSLKPAASDTEMQMLPGFRVAGRNMTGLPPSVIEEQEPLSASAKPKGILVNKPPAANTRRNFAIANTEVDGKDPLAHLMKDAPRGSRRNALLNWCQAKTRDYENVEVTNFSSSWNDGLAFCALMHAYLPDMVPFSTLDNKDKRRNFSLAFHAAESVGIPAALSVDEMVALERPDWQSVMAYVTSIYAHFET